MKCPMIVKIFDEDNNSKTHEISSESLPREFLAVLNKYDVRYFLRQKTKGSVATMEFLTAGHGKISLVFENMDESSLPPVMEKLSDVYPSIQNTPHFAIFSGKSQAAAAWRDSALLSSISKKPELLTRLSKFDPEDFADFVQAKLGGGPSRLSASDAVEGYEAYKAREEKKAAEDEENGEIERLRAISFEAEESNGDVTLKTGLKDGYRLVRLASKKARVREGKIMNHCVKDHYADSESVYSVRTAANIPICTIEYENDEIKQIKGKNNGPVAEEHVERAIEAVESLGVHKINKGDMLHLGYQYVTAAQKNAILRHCEPVKFKEISSSHFVRIDIEIRLRNTDEAAKFCLAFQNDLSKILKITRHLPTIKSILECGCLDALSLRLASEKGYLEIVKLLLDHSSDVHAEKEYALHDACYNGHVEVAKLLIDNGANIHALNSEALRDACLNGYLEIVRLLVEHGTDVHSVRDYALRHACEDGHLELAKFLLDHGSDVHACEDESLRLACVEGHLEIAKLLFEHGANIHTREDIALRGACEYGHLELAKFLIEHGADVHPYGEEALRLAREEGHSEIEKLLMEHAAKIR